MTRRAQLIWWGVAMPFAVGQYRGSDLHAGVLQEEPEPQGGVRPISAQELP